VGTETAAAGAVPARLTPIFRDREELSAASSLSERIREALAVSDVLIVLCSPAAKASQWVNQEIRLFRELHPDRPVLAALIDGEPTEAFPDALTAGGAEPIAPDFRKGKDGHRLALMKLVAGMSGVPLDALVQRDAQRQTRRVMAITGSALSAVLVMALLLVFAVRAQREAERQRAEAEGLVEYMLTDLRDRLKGVGRLDVMTAVNERAMGYYGGQGDLSGLPTDSLLRRARILHAMGEDDLERGDYPQGMTKFVEAERVTAAAIRGGKTRDTVFTNMQSEYWIGRVHELQKQWQPALQRYQAYREGGVELLRFAPQGRNEMMEMGWGHAALARVQLRGLRSTETARQEAQKAEDFFAKIVAKYPADYSALSELADMQAWIADTHYDEKDYRTALTYRTRQLEMRTRLWQMQPNDNRLRGLLGDAEFAVAVNKVQVQLFDDAKKHLKVALQHFTYLRQVDPDNAGWRAQTLMVAASLAQLANKLSNQSLFAQTEKISLAIIAEAKAKGDPKSTYLEDHWNYMISHNVNEG
jgi:tetratricopeptide (TPR) repeat protein